MRSRIGGSDASAYEVPRRFNSRERKNLALDGLLLLSRSDLNTQFRIRRILVTDPDIPPRTRKELRRDVGAFCSPDGLWLIAKLYLEAAKFSKAALKARGISLDFEGVPITLSGLISRLEAAYVREAALEEARIEAIRQAAGEPCRDCIDAEIKQAKEDLLGEATCRGRVTRTVEYMGECNLVTFPETAPSKKREPVKIIIPQRPLFSLAEEIGIGALALSARSATPLFAEAQKSSAAKAKIPRASGGKND